MADVPTTCGELGGDADKARYQADEDDDPVVGYWCDEPYGNIYYVQRNENTYSVTIDYKQEKRNIWHNGRNHQT